MYTGGTYNPLIHSSNNMHSGMDCPTTPQVNNGFGLDSIRSKLNYSNYNKDDISTASIYRIPLLRDEDTRTNVKSHTISALPEYLVFSQEELRYLNILKKNKASFEENSTYANLTRQEKFAIKDRLNDPFVASTFEIIEKNKFLEWTNNMVNGQEDDTFKGMRPGTGTATPNRFNTYGGNTGAGSNNNFSGSNNNSNPFFKPNNNLNTVNNSNSNQNSTPIAGGNFLNSLNVLSGTKGNNGNNNEGVRSFSSGLNTNNSNGPNFNSNQMSSNTGFNNTNINGNPFATVNNNSSNINSNPFLNNSESNNNSTIKFNTNNQLNQNSGGSINNPFQNNSTNTNNNNNYDFFGNSNPQNSNFNTANNNNFNFNKNNINNNSVLMNSSNNNNLNHLNKPITFQNQGMNFSSGNNAGYNFNNTNNSNQSSGFNSYGNNNMTSNTMTNSNLNNMGYNFFNNSNSSMSFSGYNSNLNSNNYNNNGNFNTFKDTNLFLQQSYQSLTQDNQMINLLDKMHKKENNNINKLANRFVKEQLSDFNDHKPVKNFEVNLNQWRRTNYFIPEEISNPVDRKMLIGMFEGRKVEQIFADRSVLKPFQKDSSRTNNSLFTQSQTSQESRKVLQEIQKKDYNTYNKSNINANENNINSNKNINTANKNMRNFSQKSQTPFTNPKLSENHKLNPFLTSVVRGDFANNITTNNESVNPKSESDFKEKAFDIEMDNTDSQFKSRNPNETHYTLKIEFEGPKQICYSVKTTNILSIGRLKVNIIKQLKEMEEFENMEVKPMDIAFIVDGELDCRDTGMYNLDKLPSSEVNFELTPVSHNFSGNSNQSLREVKIKATFTQNSNIIERLRNFYSNKSYTQSIERSQSNKNSQFESSGNKGKLPSYMPSLTKDYILYPSYETLKRMTEDELRRVEHFSIENEFGIIIYSVPIDLTYTNIDSVVMKKNLFQIESSDMKSFDSLSKFAYVTLKGVVNEKEENEEDFSRFLDSLKELCKRANVCLNYNFYSVFRLNLKIMTVSDRNLL